MRRCAVLVLLFAAVGCGKGADSQTVDAGVDAGPQLEDVRVAMPAADPSYVDIATPEETIPAGTEKLFCYYVSNSAGEFAVSQLVTMQGKYGHHIAIVRTKDGSTKPDGTVEDCSDLSSMSNFAPFLIPTDALPAGYATDVPQNIQFVVQFHYVNTGTQPLLVRDVLRMKKVDPASVTTWVSAFINTDLTFSLPAGEHTKVDFDCTVPSDLQLILLLGHMHEFGSRFEVKIGPDANSLQSEYLVDPWTPNYRDLPPVSLFFTNPIQLHQGDIVHTTCEWDNSTADSIIFPREMCVTTGYVAGSKDPVLCEH